MVVGQRQPQLFLKPTQVLGKAVSTTGQPAVLLPLRLAPGMFSCLVWIKLHNSSSWHSVTGKFRHNARMTARHCRAPRSSQAQTVSLSTPMIRAVARNELPSTKARRAVSNCTGSASSP